MKSLPLILNLLTDPHRRRNLVTLARLLGVFLLLVLMFSVAFLWLMQREGESHSWPTAVYWVLVVMSTLGFGDITFHSDAGRVFSVIVLLSGSVFMLVLLPFTFIQFFYVPWMEAQAALRAPRRLPARITGHVIFTGIGIIERALIRILRRHGVVYVVIVSDLPEALKLSDEGFDVMLGDVDDINTYENARAQQAAMVVTAARDTTNTNIAFTVREISAAVRITATASSSASVDILELAGCTQVLQLGEMLGQALARRVPGRDARCQVVGEFGELLFAEAAVAGTELEGIGLRDSRITERERISVVGAWDHGRFTLAGPETRMESTSVVLLAGTRSGLDEYNSRYHIQGEFSTMVIIIGGGRVGRAAARALENQGIEYRIVERNTDRIRDPARYVTGDAAELEVLEEAGIRRCSTVIVTTHDDDINVYLTIYCRRLRPDVHILSRANQDRNVSTLHRAGADSVMSYASLGASSIYNTLKRQSLLLLADGLDAFRVPVPAALAGRTLAECRFRQTTGCSVVAVEIDGQVQVSPAPDQPLPAHALLIVVGDTESEERFFAVQENL